MNADPRPRPRPALRRRPPSPPRRTRRVAGLLVAGSVALGAAACSSDTTTNAGPAATAPAVTASSSGGTSTSSARTGSTTGTSGTSGTTSRTGSTRGTTSTARAGTTSTSDPNVLTPPSIVVKATPGNEEYCKKVATALEELSAVALMAIGGGTNGDELLPQVKSLYADLADTAPSAIKDDVQTISSKLQTINSVKELRTLDSDAEASAAGQRFTAWIKSECGFDPNNPGS